MKISRFAAHMGGVFQMSSGLRSVVHCAAVAGAVALTAFAPAAHAVVVVSPAANLAVPTTTAGIYINVVTGVSGTSQALAPGWDVNPYSSTALNFFSTAAAGNGYVTSTNSPVGNLTAGTVVGAASLYTASTVPAATFGALANQWTLNATNYFGFRFIGEDALLHYGYGTMIVGATPLVRTIGQLFYESVAGTAITITPVPEPSSVALMLLGGLGLAGVAARRRRQSAA